MLPGRTTVEPGRTGPEGVGAPERFQAELDQRAWEHQSGSRQNRTRGRGSTRSVPGRTGPEGVEGRAEGPPAAAVAGGECTPEGARGEVQGSRVAIAEAVPEQASQ